MLGLLVFSWRHRPIERRPATMRFTAFTLIELLVVVVILTVLASLSLAGLASARQRAKIDKTRSTIRKIDAVVRPMYDSYPARRIAVTGSDRRTNAQTVLLKRRQLMLREMPDTRLDVVTTASFATLPSYSRYPGSGVENDSAECLYMIVSRSGFEPDALETFRGDEIGDTDATGRDGAPEFIDGWGRALAFFRWAPGFLPPLPTIQTNDPLINHDPLDPMRVDLSGYALVPLIASGGPDEDVGLAVNTTGWLARGPLLSLILPADPANPATLVGGTTSSTSTADNITNHDLLKR